MASTQNGRKESPPHINDDGPLDPIQNGNRKSPPQLEDDVVKIVVVGEPRCGKTTFIQQYYDHHFPSETYSHNGVRVYNCVLEKQNQQWRTSIFEIPSHPDFFPEQRIPHYEEADIIVFMYAIDDPISFEMLSQRWIVETINIIESRALPVVFVGNKKDLRDDQQVIARLALENRSPVTLEQASEMLYQVSGSVGIVECSACDLGMVENAFKVIFAYILPTD